MMPVRKAWRTLLKQVKQEILDIPLYHLIPSPEYLRILSPWLGGTSVASWALPELPAEAALLLRVAEVPTFVVLRN
jgi:hypothetical protein